MKSLFSKLSNFARDGEKRFQHEDFFTEIFAQVLRCDEGLCVSWVSSVLKRKKQIEKLESLKVIEVETQKRIPALPQHDLDSKIDMAVMFEEGERTGILFIENKLNAEEGWKQLERYYQHLIKSEADWGALIYVTQWPDPGKGSFLSGNVSEKFDFIQIRWADVYDFFYNRPDKDSLQKEFIKFMEDKELNIEKQFSPRYLVAMDGFKSVIKMMDEVIANIEPFFKEVNKGSCDYSARSTGLQKENRYIIYRIYQNRFIVCLGFWMKSDDGSEFPAFGMEIESNPSEINRKTLVQLYDQIVKESAGKWKAYNLDKEKLKFGITFRKGFQEILSYHNHLAAITDFFKDCIDEQKRLITAYPNLNWNT